MRCKKCGTILLDSDTYCGKCGTKVKVDVCPSCGEILRPGMSFCSNCGHKVIENTDEISDDDIPVTNQMATVDIPFDVIEENIIRDVERQLDSPINTQKNNISKPKYEDDIQEVEDDNEYEEDEFEDDEYEDDIPEIEEDDEEEKSVLSRLIIAAGIVIGLIIILVIASIFFSNRKNKNDIDDNENVIEEQQNVENEDTSSSSDGIIGNIKIIKDVNIRDYPSTDNSSVIGVARVGEEYAYYGYAEGNSNWVHIKKDESTDGYVYKEYVQVNE